MLDPPENHQTLLIWEENCGHQASLKPVLALGPSVEERVLQVGAPDVLLLKRSWLICYKGVTDKNGLWKTIPAAVGCGESPGCPEKPRKSVLAVT